MSAQGRDEGNVVGHYKDMAARLCGFALVSHASPFAAADIANGKIDYRPLRDYICPKTREHFPPLLVYRMLAQHGQDIPDSALFHDAEWADGILADFRAGKEMPKHVPEKAGFALLYCALLDYLDGERGEPDFLAEVYVRVREALRHSARTHAHLPHWAAHAAVYACHPGVGEVDFATLRDDALRFIDFFGITAPPTAYLEHACTNLHLRVTGLEGRHPLYDAVKKGRSGELPWDVLDTYPLSDVLAVMDVLHPEKVGEVQQRRLAAALGRMPAPMDDIDAWNQQIAEVAREEKLVDRAGLPLVHTAAQLDDAPTRIGEGGDYPVPEHWRKMGTKGALEAVRFLGGSTIGKTCVLLRFSSGSLLLDFGSTKPGASSWSRFEELRTVEAVLISHAHLDHIGGLLTMFKEWKHHVPWFSLPKNQQIARIVLEDAARLADIDPIHIEPIMRHFVAVRPFEPIEVLPGVKASPWPAGHVPGAASWLIETADYSVFFTGDYCLRPLLSVERYRWPGEDIRREVDILITEGTYADGVQEFIDGDQSRFELRDTVRDLLREGGQVLVPVMSLGRAQEVTRCLEGTPWRVGLFGMGARITRECGMEVPQNVVVSDTARDTSLYDVIVAPAGCLQGGVSKGVYESSGCESGASIPVVLTGHQFPGTLGRNLRDTSQAKMVRFSAHASAREFDETLRMFPNARQFLIHFPGRRDAVLERFPTLEIPLGQRAYGASDLKDAVAK